MRALDNLTPQVHGGGGRPEYLAADVELEVGDVRDPEAVRRALQGVDAVVHLAARVGVGQSMYEIAEYTAVNTLGTAVLLEALAETPVRKVLVASSMSVYGEGLYRTADGREAEPEERAREQLELGEWELPGLEPVPTPETKRPSLRSIYALTKYDQERAALVCGAAYGIPAVALRLFNAYGTRQALSNPYTGVLAIFASRLLNDRQPRVFEDGLQRRDFVAVSDVARAFALALERDGADGQVLNVGSGSSVTVREVALQLAAHCRQGDRAGAHRRVPRRRHPPLLRRHRARAGDARVRAAGGAVRRDARAGHVARGAGGGRSGRGGCCRVEAARARDIAEDRNLVKPRLRSDAEGYAGRTNKPLAAFSLWPAPSRSSPG